VVVRGTVDPEPVTLAGTGVAIWDALERPRSLDDLAGTLATMFAIDIDRVRCDLTPVLDDLVARGVLEVAR
jgi:hypothetical protein